jgi:hypothetical protein
MIAGAAYLVRALLFVVAATNATMYPRFSPDRARGAATVVLVVGAVAVVIALMLSVPYFLAGFAIMWRKSWGKFLGVGCAVISVLVGLFYLYFIFRSLHSYYVLAQFIRPLPLSFHLRALGGLLFDVLFVALLVAQALMAFMLLNDRRSHEFR